MNSEEGQKQAASLFESHLGIDSHVFMHLGTSSGHGAGVGMLGVVETVVAAVIQLVEVELEGRIVGSE